jgi:predicted phosphodiesterase
MIEHNPPKQRDQSDYLHLTRSVLANHLKTEIKKSKGKARLVKITEYLTTRPFTWLYYYLVNRFGPVYPYKGYPKGMNGVYQVNPGNNTPVTICIAADWATDTPESTAVADSMRKLHPDYTIHLGDTYYVGAPHEIGANFIWKNAPWVRGAKGSFALLGNHEMYARGIAYFKKLLPTLGVVKDGRFTGQQAGFFCLENDYWRILGLDTGYHSIGRIPIVENFSWFAPDCHFDELLINWLQDDVKLIDPEDKRGLLVLTHHQYISAFQDESEYLKPAEQLAAIIGTDRPVIWLFGHEHKFSMYEKTRVNNGITAYGRCIGHGGMPVEITSNEFKKDPANHGYHKLVVVDERKRPCDSTNPLGYNGFVQLSLSNHQLQINYRDSKQLLVTETWSADNANGTIAGKINPRNNLLKPQKGKVWDDAVKA